MRIFLKASFKPSFLWSSQPQHTNVVTNPSTMAAEDCGVSTLVAASGWAVAAGFAVMNIKSLFDFPVGTEPDCPVEGDPTGAPAAC